MNEIIDKKIHEDEFRLRILLTNECDRNCSYCLNDFQNKGKDFVDYWLVRSVIDDYCCFCFLNDLKPIISFSGGEPGLYPSLDKLLSFANDYKFHPHFARVQLNTNGLVDTIDCDLSDVDVRYHVGPGLRNTIKRFQKAVYVIQEGETSKSIINFLKPFHDQQMKIKTFVDMNASHYFKTVVYPKILTNINEHFPASGRFTGIQENRGVGCDGCKKDCVTLKALWIFPNDTCSPCPQKPGTIYTVNSIMDAYNFHLRTK